jgi:hypothetical protein
MKNILPHANYYKEINTMSINIQKRIKGPLGVAVVVFFGAYLVPFAHATQIGQNSDIVVTNHFNSSISVIFNNGNRQFVKQVPDLASASNPTEPVAGDLNNDDLTDLVVVDGFGQPTLSIFLGQANGQFSARSAFNLGFDSAMTAIGDFNNDGNADLFVSHWSGGGGNEVQILLGNGLGNFSVGTTRSNVPGANAVAVGDFDKDGKLDGVVTNWTAGSVTVLFGNGTGGFKDPSTDVIFPAGNRPQFVTVGDFNNDSNPDVAFAHGLSSFLSVYLGNGNGTFGARIDLPADANNGGSSSVQSGDLDNNGYDDLVTYDGPAGLSVFLSQPSGFAAPVISAIETLSAADDFTISDFDGDGKADVVLTDRNNNKVSIYFGDGAGHFDIQSKQDVSVGSGPVGVAVANLNTKTIGLDIDPNTLNVKSNGNYITAYLSGDAVVSAGNINKSSIKITQIEFTCGNISIPTNIAALSSPTQIGDFDGDGILDLMVKFSRASVIAAVAGHRGDAKFTVKGATNSGLKLVGTDSIRIR